MNYQDTQIGQQVVRSKGDYVVGRIGEIIERDENKLRVKVAWGGNATTWVAVTSIEPTYIPYEIMPGKIDESNGTRISYPKYIKK